MSDENGVTGELLRTTPEIAASYRRSTISGGDLVVTIGPSFGKVMVVPRELEGANLTQGTARVSLRGEHEARFVFWALRSSETSAFWAAEAQGATLRSVNLEELARTPIPLPPRATQSAIAAFLDRETARIDALIAQKERLLTLLEEKRQALISHAVTKGLDPNARMKKSGNKMLGMVPANWTVTPLQHLVEAFRPIVYGIVQPGPDVDEGIPIIKGHNCEEGHLYPHRLAKTTLEIESAYLRSRVRPGDLVYEIRGSIGRVVMVPPELPLANLTQDTARVAPRPEIDGRWLRFALAADPFLNQMLADARGATISGVNIFTLRRGLVVVPAESEQTQIADYLTTRTEALDRVSDSLDRSILLLRERRQSLITAAVTGQLDAATYMPQEMSA